MPVIAIIFGILALGCFFIEAFVTHGYRDAPARRGGGVYWIAVGLLFLTLMIMANALATGHRYTF